MDPSMEVGRASRNDSPVLSVLDVSAKNGLTLRELPKVPHSKGARGTPPPRGRRLPQPPTVPPGRLG